MLDISAPRHIGTETNRHLDKSALDFSLGRAGLLGCCFWSLDEGMCQRCVRLARTVMPSAAEERSALDLAGCRQSEKDKFYDENIKIN